MTDRENAIKVLKNEQDVYDLAISAIKKVDKIEKIIDDLEVDKIDAIKASEHIRAILDEEE
jgi:hypothetical protein